MDSGAAERLGSMASSAEDLNKLRELIDRVGGDELLEVLGEHGLAVISKDELPKLRKMDADQALEIAIIYLREIRDPLADEVIRQLDQLYLEPQEVLSAVSIMEERLETVGYALRGVIGRIKMKYENVSQDLPLGESR